MIDQPFERVNEPILELVPYQYPWWCLRLFPISGRYIGEMTSPDSGRYKLDLRVDIDQILPNSPVMSRVSGDIFKVHKFFGFTWSTFVESWIMNNPSIEWKRCSVKISGLLTFWESKGWFNFTWATIEIPWSRLTGLGPASVKFASWGSRGYEGTYECPKHSLFFRDVDLEVDVCSSVNSAPILPEYDSHAHTERPADYPQRTLTIEECYRDAGIEVTIDPTHTVIDDSATSLAEWSADELHDAMEDNFSQYSGSWPKWKAWCLLATEFETYGVTGIMFDNSGRGTPTPHRQGYAVFRDALESFYGDLPTGAPADDAEADSLRHYLYVYVHEFGHCFNLYHSWIKSLTNPPGTDRPDALSWMNYPQYVTDYWDDFRFSFDDEEIIHLRHGNRNNVIMGGTGFGEGAAFEVNPEILGEVPIEFIIRSKQHFRFLEPVVIELKVKNSSKEPLKLDTQLAPEYGTVTLRIKSPDGRLRTYDPPMYYFGRGRVKELAPGGRHCQTIWPNFGKLGHYFDNPGMYEIQASYRGAPGIEIPSPIHRIHIGNPVSHEENLAAKDYFTREVGLAMYLGGSDSPYLQKGMESLRRIANVFDESSVGAHISLILGENLLRPFRPIRAGKRVMEREAKPSEGISIIERGLEVHRRDETTFQNITYHKAVRLKATMLSSIGEKDSAMKELKGLSEYLHSRGVKKDILDEIDEYGRKL